jgi:5'-deoxynucleotidase YfbR-like HD superfamily hydrolase
MTQQANFLYEVGMLNRTPRSGLAFLGSGEQSVSEHAFRMLHAAWLLSRLSDEPVDELHLLHLVLFHDLPETRTGDFNHVHHKYDRVNQDRLYADLEKELPYGEEIAALVREFELGATPEARLASDADQLDLIATLKEQLDLGNSRADEWIASARGRLKTASGRRLAEELLETPSDDWWFHDKHDSHWIDRGRGT